MISDRRLFSSLMEAKADGSGTGRGAEATEIICGARTGGVLRWSGISIEPLVAEVRTGNECRTRELINSGLNAKGHAKANYFAAARCSRL